MIEIGAGTRRYSPCAGTPGICRGRGGAGSPQHRVFAKTSPDGNDHNHPGKRPGFIRDTLTMGTTSRLLLGPLYHLYPGGQKRRAIGRRSRDETGRRDFCRVCYFRRLPPGQGFNRGNIDVAEYIEEGVDRRPDICSKVGARKVCLSSVAKGHRPTMADFPTERLHYVAADGCALFMREAIDAMDGERFCALSEISLRHLNAGCGITSHAIDIFQKAGLQNLVFLKLFGKISNILSYFKFIMKL